MKHLVAALGFASVVLCVTHQVRAWCRTTTCDQQNPPASCGPTNPYQCTTEGTPIAWPSTCVSTSVSAAGSPLLHITAAKMREIVQSAFNQWTTADCADGTGHPNFVVDTFPDVNCTDVTGDNGYKSTGPNYNVWIFRDNGWPYDATDESAIAITTTQFSPDTGVIYDSDVELNSNSPNFTFTTTDPPLNVGMDLASVVQHEAGHFLGMAHSQVPNATMFPSLGVGDVTRRILTQDDIDGICNAYPPGTLDPNCDPEPRHGFSTECTLEKGCCTVAPGRVNRARRLPESLILGAFLAIAVVRRRRIRSR